jgi:hypothetical protein
MNFLNYKSNIEKEIKKIIFKQIIKSKPSQIYLITYLKIFFIK